MAGNVVAGTYGHGIRANGTGSIVVNGDYTVSGGTVTAVVGIFLNGNAQVTINGNVSGGTVTGGYGINAALTTGGVIVNGNVTGGSNASAYGIYQTGSGAITITGTVTGGSVAGCAGILSSGTGLVTVNGKLVDTSSGSAVYARRLYFNPSITDYHISYNGIRNTTLRPKSALDFVSGMFGQLYKSRRNRW
ncbi:MAG: hypothetical protein WC220_11300 [Pedobacter sp.]